MKRLIFFIYIAVFYTVHLLAVGYNVNFGLSAGITECIGGKNIQKNVNFWDEPSNFSNFLDYGGFITTDIVISERFSVETGFSYKVINLNYCTNDGKLYGSELCRINYSELNFPIMAKFVFPIKKTSQLINSIDLAFGANISYNFEEQSYSDADTNFNGYFLSPEMNIGTLLKITYTHKIGPGRAFAGFQTDIDFLQQKYSENSRTVNLGNNFSFAPVIGYTFIIKENKNIAKVTEKNRRIKDLVVN